MSNECLIIHLDGKLTVEQVAKLLREVSDRIEHGSIPKFPFDIEVTGEVRGQILIDKY